MQTYDIGLVPGPVSVPPELRAVYQINYGSADMEDEFLRLYQRCETHLGKILATRNRVVIKTGEGMIALWGGLKSVLRPGDKVLAVANGVFGYGIGDMAQQLGMEVEVVGFGHDEVPDPQQVREVAKRFRPRLVTAVHCETPSGSGGGVEVLVDDWHIDLGLLGSQKVLSLPPDLAMVTVSERAWAAVEEVAYVGYDSLAPWKTVVTDGHFPYTHNWHGMAGLLMATRLILNEGLAVAFRRHADVAAYCRGRMQAMGIALYPVSEEICSPTVTAAKIPAGWSWEDLDQELRARGLVVGGSYGSLAGKVFRIGHMGSQAKRDLVERGLDVLEEVLQSK
jgi:aspartate aminotransferase-like enzyme